MNNCAIVIGINHYEHLLPKYQLNYAVRDAEFIKEFLCNKGGVKSNNIGSSVSSMLKS